jgi:pimeloyl-ACP methyl ester carboxylesterase
MGDGIKIQLAEWAGEGPAVLCVHGITANCRCWDNVAGALSPAYRFLAMDLRGRGYSDKPPSGYSLSHHCEDIRCLLNDLGLDKVVLMGHSLGAFITLAFTAAYPERVERLVLVDGGGKLSEEQMAKVFAGIKPSLDRLGKVFSSFEEYLNTMKQAPFLKPWMPILETYYRYEVEEVEGGVRSRIMPEHIQEEAENLGKVDVGEFYKKVSCPVLILRATEGLLAQDDILLPGDVVERMVREIPNATRCDIRGANHYMIVFQPIEERDKAVREFLSSLET